MQNSFDPNQAVDGAARLLRDLLNRFDRTDLALAAYNAGPGRRAPLRRHPAVPGDPELCPLRDVDDGDSSMTVIPLPLPVSAGPGSVPAPMGADAEASAETFAALVTQLLSGQGQQPGTGQPVPVPGVPVTAVGEGIDEAADGHHGHRPRPPTPPADLAADAAAAVVPSTQPITAQVAGFLAVLPVLPIAAALAAAAAPAATADDLTTTTVTSTSPTTAEVPTGAADPTATAVTADPATDTSVPTRAATTDPAPTSSTSTASDEAVATEPDAGTTAPAAGTRHPEPRSSETIAPARTDHHYCDHRRLTAVGAESVTGPAGPATDTRPTPNSPVTSQVFPEVTRLVSAGNGTHRVRLQLEPEALGEVRVVLTIRNGEVHVRLAGGEDAQRALREGAPELRRLLELAGASDTRIVVRDLNSGSASGNGSNANLTGQGPGGFGRGDSGVDARRRPFSAPARRDAWWK